MTTRLEPRSPEPTAESVQESSPDATTLPLDVVYGILSNQRRRRTLRYLDQEGKTTLGELAEHLASLETGKPVSAIDSDERKRAYICLYQCHLPKMDDANVIDFDAARKVITTGENSEQVRQYLPGGKPDGEADGAVQRWTPRFNPVAMLIRRLYASR